MIKTYPFNDFKYGIISNAKIPKQKLPDGAASDSLNWLTLNGKIELARGYELLGSDAGTGRVSGLRVGEKANGTQVPFRTRGKKVEYYDTVTEDWIEIGSDILGTVADGEDISIEKFESRAGKQVWLNSPHSGPKKIMVANPGSYSDMYDASYNYKAHLAIIQNQAFGWDIGGTDKNVVRLSYINTKNLTDYTQIVAEVLAAGGGGVTTFAGTLAFKAGGSKRNCLDVSVTDGTETFTDDLSGNLVGSAGGTGTINYTTGAISVTFAVAPGAVNVTVTYRWSDETASGGIANFVVPGSRVSGDPNVFRQDTGGDIKNISVLREHRFVGHARAFYDILLALDDTDATNNIWRQNIGVPYLRGAFSAAEGIYTVDLSDENNPEFVVISYNSASTDIKPLSISKYLDLTAYAFDKVFVTGFNEYILYSCRRASSDENDRTFLYHKKFKTWDLLDYAISVGDIYNGTFLGGNSISNNVFTYFSGYDAEGEVIENYWRSGISKLKISRLKKSKKFLLEGDIGPDQEIAVFASLDRGAFVEIEDPSLDSNGDVIGGSLIKGSGAYVDRTQRVLIGSNTIGSAEIGGGTDGIEAYHYEREVSFSVGKFREIELKFVAREVGYASINNCEFRDVRLLQNKVIQRYRG